MFENLMFLMTKPSKEENAIASVMALLETLDEGVAFTPEKCTQMIECIEANRECEW